MRNGLFSLGYLGIRPTHPHSELRGQCDWNEESANQKDMRLPSPKQSWMGKPLPFEQQLVPRLINTPFYSSGPLLNNAFQLHIVEIDHQSRDPPFTKKNIVYFPAEATNDFPVAIQVSKKYRITFLVRCLHIREPDFRGKPSSSLLNVKRRTESLAWTRRVNVDEQIIIMLNNTDPRQIVWGWWSLRQATLPDGAIRQSCQGCC